MTRQSVRAALLVVCAGLAVAGSEGSALANLPFPGYVEKHLGVATLPAPPAGQGCELCHNNPAGGIGTATQPFGMLMKAQGIVYYSSEAQVDAALDAIKANPATTGYITDIEKGVDPDTDPALQGDATNADTVTPTYGCGSTVSAVGLASSPGGATFFVASVLGLAVGARRARRLRSRRPRG